MGILAGLFGRKAGRAPLDPAGAAAASIAARSAQLEPFVRKVHVPLELVPAADAVYAYLGKPPGDFGMAWFEGGREASFATLKEKEGVSQGRIQALAARLGAAYKKHGGAERYTATIAGKEVLVNPSEPLAAAIRKAIDEAVS